MSIERPLAGVTIVEAVGANSPVALALATGMCGRLAKDMGAEVISIAARGNRLDPALDDFLNFGKRRVEALSAGYAAAIAEAGADCLIADSATFETIAQPHCHTVAIAMSSDDPTGGSEFTIEARSGLLDLVGDPRRRPLRLGGHQIPYAAGLAAYLGMVDMLTHGDAAPLHRRVDLLDIGVWLNWKAIGGAALGLPVPSRTGSDGPWSIAPCSDGFVALVYRASDWDALKAALGDARLDDPRFQEETDRRDNRAALNEILRQVIAPLDRAAIRRLSLDHRLPLGPVWTPEELQRDPHTVARTFLHARRRGETALMLPAAPVKWNGQTFPPDDQVAPAQAA